jgi:hypothetical protein
MTVILQAEVVFRSRSSSTTNYIILLHLICPAITVTLQAETVLTTLSISVTKHAVLLRQTCPAATVLLQAEMVFTTLSSSARDVFSKLVRPFELVLIDEAAQAAEIAALQPLVYGAK